MTDDEKLVDIIIPTFNRSALLKQVLPSYWRQKNVRSIIIVDDGGKDDVEKVLAELMPHAPVPIKVVRLEKHSGLPHARNVGVKNASAPFVFMGEDDVILHNAAIPLLFQYQSMLAAEIVTGRRIFLRENEKLTEAEIRAEKEKGPVVTFLPFEGYFERKAGEKPVQLPFVHSNALIKRGIFEHVQYDEWYKGNAFREETDFYLQAGNLGYKIFFIPEITCYHLTSSKRKKSGARAKSFFWYEFWVIRNNWYFFKKNTAILNKQFGIHFPRLFFFLHMFARYPYAAIKRVRRMLR